MRKDLERILCAIPKGKCKAIHNGELAKQFGVSIHTIKKHIQEARMQGIPIVSDTSGYWITDDREELKAFIDSMEKQGKKRFKTIKALKRTLNDIEGQNSLFNALHSIGTVEENNEQKQAKEEVSRSICEH